MDAAQQYVNDYTRGQPIGQRIFSRCFVVLDEMFSLAYSVSQGPEWRVQVYA